MFRFKQVFQSDGTFVGKFGSHGNKIGQLEHPHYIAVSNTNRVIVSDCNNHRIQIFDVNGRVISSFGTEGSENGQFKFPKYVYFTTHVNVKHPPNYIKLIINVLKISHWHHTHLYFYYPLILIFIFST